MVQSETELTVVCTIKSECGVVVSETLTLNLEWPFDRKPSETLYTVNSSQVLPMDRRHRIAAILANQISSELAPGPKVEIVPVDNLNVKYCGAVFQSGCAVFVVDENDKVHSIQAVRRSI